MDFAAQMSEEAAMLEWSFALLVVGACAALLASLACMLLAALTNRH